MCRQAGMIQLYDTVAFIDKRENGQCDDRGDVVMRSKKGKEIKWHTYRQWAHLPTKDRNRKIQEYHIEIDDPIVEASVTCSKCGVATIDNAYWL